MVDMFSMLVHSMGVPPSLSELRMAASYLLTFLPYTLNKLVKLRCSDITFSKPNMRVLT